ncbi:MAG: SUF system NifU family Fe-S cluster assembly protein [Bacteroidia bacterium]|nr:SUF system NifU family Fe-S cluster assembly protein [Bacteroidia bacterium]MCX7651337.1 SUF system NifU family Fe-S cluster assembly protein [Bacteroidia bacterium]MDW8417143.1 SUF system NifU family Fe-S cluster assembly protein [Bacteroidia bacterium]
MSDLQSLYQELVMEHNRYPRNFGQIPQPTHQGEGYNPLCGDHVIITLHVEEEVIKDIKFHGKSCAICRASASVMTTIAKGREVSEVERIFNAFHELLTREGEPESYSSIPAGVKEKLNIFSTVKNFPMRVKCASLPWHTLHAALNHADQVISSE